MVIAGIAVFFHFAEVVGLYWIVVYCFIGVIGTYIIAIHYKRPQKRRENRHQKNFLFSLLLLLPGLLLLLFTSFPFTRLMGFVFAGFASIAIYSISLQGKMYAFFISNRINKEKWPLTFRSIIQSLWTYFVLVLGSVVIGILGLLVYACLFLNIERRKTIFHYMLYYYSHFYVWTMPIKEQIINISDENFQIPSVIISNHQSLIDTPMMFSLYPKVIILVNDWVYRSPIFGHISKMADFYNVTAGIDSIIEKIRGRVNQGYSIIVFPEGTRSKTGKLQRFHRGAFYLAEILKLDIVPSVICGSKNSLKKGEFWGRATDVVQLILPRIAVTDPRFGENYSKRAKYFRKYLSEEYEKIAEEYAISGFSDVD